VRGSTTHTSTSTRARARRLGTACVLLSTEKGLRKQHHEAERNDETATGKPRRKRIQPDRHIILTQSETGTRKRSHQSSLTLLNHAAQNAASTFTSHHNAPNQLHCSAESSNTRERTQFGAKAKDPDRARQIAPASTSYSTPLHTTTLSQVHHNPDNASTWATTYQLKAGEASEEAKEARKATEEGRPPAETPAGLPNSQYRRRHGQRRARVPPRKAATKALRQPRNASSPWNPASNHLPVPMLTDETDQIPS